MSVMLKQNTIRGVVDVILQFKNVDRRKISKISEDIERDRGGIKLMIKIRG